MSRPGGDGDIPIETPIARHRDVVPATEDRSYIAFIGGAMLLALAGGFPLAIALSLASTGTFWVERVPWLAQAHGWAQLEGWAGLFVAGMGLRLLPRFAGRRPASRPLSLSIFALLFVGAIVRTISQTAAGDGISPAGVLVGQWLWAAGAGAFAVAITVTLVRGRPVKEPWRAFAFAGAAWWFAWSATSLVDGVRGARNDALMAYPLDDATTWMVLLGAVGNFIWAVQSRSVPIFFGRKTPSLRRVIVPGLLLNGGVALVFAAGWMDLGETRARVEGVGLLLAGVSLAWLAPLAGSCWGTAHRLRPRARAAARFVLFANLAAVVCGLFLVWAGGQTLADAAFAAPGVRDAARHAFGVGVITLLIVGMAQLVAPFFAMQRVETRNVWILDHGVFWFLAAAAILRVASGLLRQEVDVTTRMHIGATAGVLAWAGLAVFAFMVVRAVQREGGIKAAIATSASHSGRR